MDNPANHQGSIPHSHNIPDIAIVSYDKRSTPQSESSIPTAQPVYVGTVPAVPYGAPNQVHGVQQPAQYGFLVIDQVQPDLIGECRGCGRQFSRPVGTHSGMASYYRCERCNGFTVADLVNSCVLS